MFFIYCTIKIILGIYSLIVGVFILNGMTCKVSLTVRTGVGALTAATFADLYYLWQWDGIFDQYIIPSLLTTIGTAFLLSRCKIDHCPIGDSKDVFQISKH